jgi:DNA (cytosine-5)-methyltransferase 1
MRKLRVATVFSGIGAPEQALRKLNRDYKIVFACDNGERTLDSSFDEIIEKTQNLSAKECNDYIKELYRKTKKINYVKQSYFANYNIDEDSWYEDIRFIDGKPYKNKIDLFVGGSPCQSFSVIGKRAGLNDARGTLFYDFARLIDEMQPRAFIYENVLGMLSHNKGKTWKHISEIFESLGYKINAKVLNSVNYGIPQNRKRLFVIGIRDGDEMCEFPDPLPLKTTMFDYLEEHVAVKHYLGEKGFKFVTTSKRASVNNEVIQTQKANQQFNWNGDFVFEPLDKVKDDPAIMERAYVGEYRGQVGVCRQLSYRECARLMGFPDDFKIVVPNIPAYRQIGNSIVVDVLVEIFKKVLEMIDDENQ